MVNEVYKIKPKKIFRGPADAHKWERLRLAASQEGASSNRICM